MQQKSFRSFELNVETLELTIANIKAKGIQALFISLPPPFPPPFQPRYTGYIEIDTLSEIANLICPVIRKQEFKISKFTGIYIAKHLSSVFFNDFK